MFKQFKIFHLTDDNWIKDLEIFENQLSQSAFKTCSSLQTLSMGWVTPMAETDDENAPLIYQLGAFYFIRLRVQQRILPNAAINEVLQESIQDFKAKQRREPSRREKATLKDEVRARLLPNAFLKSEYLWGVIQPREKLLLISTVSDSKIEKFFDILRQTIGHLPISAIAFKESTSKWLTNLLLNKSSGPFHIADNALLQEIQGDGEVSMRKLALTEQNIHMHLDEGMHVRALAMTWQDTLNFRLDQHNTITQMNYTEINEEGDSQIDDPAEGSANAKQEAELFLFASTFQQLFSDLSLALGGITAPQT